VSWTYSESVRADRTLLHDTGLAVLLASGSLVFYLLYDQAAWEAQWQLSEIHAPDLLGSLLVALSAAPVAVRRRWPLAALSVCVAIDTLIDASGYSVGRIGIASLVLLYSVAARRGLAMSMAGLLMALLAYLTGSLAGSSTLSVPSHVLVVFVFTAAWGLGRTIRLRRAYLDELRDRADRLERAKEADSRAVRAEERSRIARELHDVIAHHVSVMTVQAAAARKVLRRDADLAGEALTAVEDTGRKAMAEMRAMVSVLRAGSPAELGPQPGMSALPALVEQMREAGLPTRLDVVGRPPQLPAGIDLAAYRLVQEALTNSLRHAGPHASAVVGVRCLPEGLEVSVRDDGRGPMGPVKQTGHGLAGIRERVALYGGILSIGPLPGGGFEVHATFPLKDGR
jgi:signal transduction histidine kinase